MEFLSYKMVFNNWGHFIYVIFILLFHFGISKGAQMVKNLTSIQENQARSLGWEDPLRREWLPTLVFLPGEFHGQTSLEGYSTWGRKESDTLSD